MSGTGRPGPFIDPPVRINPFLRFAASMADRIAGRKLIAPRLLAWYPRAAVGSGILEALAAHRDRGIDRRLLKLVRMQASFSASCPFCMDMNSSRYALQGITREEAEALRDARPLAAVATFTPRERAALRYAALISRTPLSFPEEAVREVKHHFSERQIVLLASVAAQVNYWARLIQALGIPPAGFPDACPIPGGPPAGGVILDRARAWVGAPRRDAMPALTLSWAQSLNGAITRLRGEPTALSGPQAMAFTHALRSIHAGILVGVGTVLADDPLLSVRLVEGSQPTPVILDSRLRTPPSARILSRPEVRPWIFHSDAPDDAARALAAAGARLFSVSRNGGGLDLREVLRALAREGVGSLMVEGGARVLQAFLAAGFSAAAAVTIAPLVMDGLTVMEGSGAAAPALKDPVYETHGRDIVVWGELGE